MASSLWTERPVPLWLNAPGEADSGVREGRADTAPGKSLPGSAGLPFLVETFGFETAAELSDAWADLISRALEPNVFMEPGFALPAAQHLARADRPTFLAVWEPGNGEARKRLLALWTIVLPSRLFGSQVATLWCHKQAALGAPLIDCRCAEQVIAAVFAWLANAYPRLGLVVFPKLIRSGPTFARILALALESGLEWRLLDQHERAALLANRAGANLSKERGEKLRRRRRQLEKHGTVEVRSARHAGEIRDAAEAFLALEEGGWKGLGRTALLSDSSHAAFARTMTRRMAREDKCRIDALTVGARPVAMSIMLKSRDRAFVWKVAYDEAFAAQSPGVQLALEVTRIQQSDGACSMTDSCAVADHPMIDRLWADRLPIVDLALPLYPAANEMLAGFAWRNGLVRRLRKWVGERVRTLRRRTRS